MTQIELAADLLARDIETLKMTLADFSDADMLVRPVPAANHAAWQLGHLINSESGLMNMIRPGIVPPPPPEIAEKFKKETAKNDDRAFFPAKEQLLNAWIAGRNKTLAAVKTLQPADLDKPTTGRMQEYFPTGGHVLAVLSNHVAMHVGQFQVIRRKLGKPILF